MWRDAPFDPKKVTPVCIRLRDVVPPFGVGRAYSGYAEYRVSLVKSDSNAQHFFEIHFAELASAASSLNVQGHRLGPTIEISNHLCTEADISGLVKVGCDDYCIGRMMGTFNDPPVDNWNLGSVSAYTLFVRGNEQSKEPSDSALLSCASATPAVGADLGSFGPVEPLPEAPLDPLEPLPATPAPGGCAGEFIGCATGVSDRYGRLLASDPGVDQANRGTFCRDACSNGAPGLSTCEAAEAAGRFTAPKGCGEFCRTAQCPKSIDACVATCCKNDAQCLADSLAAAGGP